MKERLVFEASPLGSKQHMATLIIDEASIKPNNIYDRKLDAVLGGSKETLANRILCFVLHGITSSCRIPCSYYFTKQLNRRGLFA